MTSHAKRPDAASIGNVHFEVSSIDDLDATPSQYDVILAHSILHLVADVPRTMLQLRSMLKTDGIANLEHSVHRR